METDDMIYEDLECEIEEVVFRNSNTIRSYKNFKDKSSHNLVEANLFELVAYEADYFAVNEMHGRSFYLAMFSKNDELLYQLPFCMAKWNDGLDFMLINDINEGGKFEINYNSCTLEECVSYIIAESLFAKKDVVYPKYDHGFVVQYDTKRAVGKNFGKENNDFILWAKNQDKSKMWNFTFEEFKSRVEKELAFLILCDKSESSKKSQTLRGEFEWSCHTITCAMTEAEKSKIFYVYSENGIYYYWGQEFAKQHKTISKEFLNINRKYLRVDVDIKSKCLTGGCINFKLDTLSEILEDVENIPVAVKIYNDKIEIDRINTFCEIKNGDCNITLSSQNVCIMFKIFEEFQNIRISICIESLLINYDFGKIDTQTFFKNKGFITKDEMLEKASYKCYLTDKIDIPKTISIPQNVNIIGRSTFEKCLSLQSIVIPDGVKGIEYGAFSDCEFLESIIIPDSVTYIANNAFSECKNLKSVTIPNTIKSIRSWVFWGCKSLQNFKFPVNIKSIGNNIFKGCINLKNILVPDRFKDAEINFGVNDDIVTYYSV